MWPTRLLYISLTCIGAGLACDRNACNVGTSVGVGTIVLSSVAGAAEYQGGRLGEFEEIGDFNERPFYKQRNTEGETDVYLFFEGGEWGVNDELGGSGAYLKNNQNTSLPMTNNWLYYDGEKWNNNDTSFKLEYTSIYPCQLVRVAGKGDVLEKQGGVLGDYRPEAGRWSAGLPVYKLVGGESERFLFVREGYSDWSITSSTTSKADWIASGRATSSPSNEAGPSARFGYTSWRYWDGEEWKEGEIDVTCIEE